MRATSHTSDLHDRGSTAAHAQARSVWLHIINRNIVEGPLRCPVRLTVPAATPAKRIRQ